MNLPKNLLLSSLMRKAVLVLVALSAFGCEEEKNILQIAVSNISGLVLYAPVSVDMGECDVIEDGKSVRVNRHAGWSYQDISPSGKVSIIRSKDNFVALDIEDRGDKIVLTVYTDDVLCKVFGFFNEDGSGSGYAELGKGSYVLQKRLFVDSASGDDPWEGPWTAPALETSP